MSDDASDRTGPPSRTVVESVELNATRRTIAKRLGESYREAVHVTVSRSIDATGLLDAAGSLAKDEGSIVDVFLLALSATLDEHPRFNATFEDETLTTYREHNIAIAVDTDAGLLAPVVADVGSLAVGELAARRRELTERVQAGEQTLADLRGGTITVTNLGPLGVDAFDPIINPPQVAIVGLNRIRDDAYRTDDGEVDLRPEVNVDLTFDHRVHDGADAARVLETLDGVLTTPTDLVE